MDLIGPPAAHVRLPVRISVEISLVRQQAMHRKMGSVRQSTVGNDGKMMENADAIGNQ